METTADKIQAEIDAEKMAEADKCPECGEIMKMEYTPYLQRTWICPGCGNTETE